jgi:hypothetical protein
MPPVIVKIETSVRHLVAAGPVVVVVEDRGREGEDPGTEDEVVRDRCREIGSAERGESTRFSPVATRCGCIGVRIELDRADRESARDDELGSLDPRQSRTVEDERLRPLRERLAAGVRVAHLRRRELLDVEAAGVGAHRENENHHCREGDTKRHVLPPCCRRSSHVRESNRIVVRIDILTQCQ